MSGLEKFTAFLQPPAPATPFARFLFTTAHVAWHDFGMFASSSGVTALLATLLGLV